MTAKTNAKESSKKIQEALDLLNEAARDKKEEFEDIMTGKYSELKSTLLDMEAQAEKGAEQGAERAKELGQEAREVVNQKAHQIDEHVHQDPWKVLGWSVAGAFMVGFLLGRKD